MTMTDKEKSNVVAFIAKQIAAKNTWKNELSASAHGEVLDATVKKFPEMDENFIFGLIEEVYRLFKMF